MWFQRSSVRNRSSTQKNEALLIAGLFCLPMIVHEGIEGFDVPTPIVTIGMFDGVHLGHQSILNFLKSEAEKANGQSTVLSFWPHPRVCFEGDATKLRHLNSIEEKINRLSLSGIGHFVIIPFSKEFSQLSPERFVHEVLVKRMNVHTVIVGYDHNFGHKGAGDYDLLKKLGDEFGFNVKQLPALAVKGENISSTKIRNALHAGDIETANHYLSYPYSLTGKVEPGKQLGRTIGFPTANIALYEKLKLIPHNGVYIITAKTDYGFHRGIMNIGTRPTVDNSTRRSIEAYLFDFDKDLYGKEISIQFHSKLREELKFSSLDALKTQIMQDECYGRQYFKTNGIRFTE